MHAPSRVDPRTLGRSVRKRRAARPLANPARCGATSRQMNMITRFNPQRQAQAWQQELARAVTRPDELARMLELDDHWLAGARAAAHLFPLRVPRGYVARMVPGDVHDPLLRQVLPLDAECAPRPGFSHDPVGDLHSMVRPGVLHKYHGRVLLIATGACAIHCRYCFRRHFPYGDAHASAEQWTPALDYIREDPSISEVILSGGDPLTLADHRLSALLEALERIEQLERIRIHTRLPVVLPERITPELVRLLTGSRLKAVVVIHANHPRELDPAVGETLAALAEAGATLLNQAVLLRGINDDGPTQADLCLRLFEQRTMPYYLHMLDPVEGAAHFQVPADLGLEIMEYLRTRLPGYLLPRLVREQPGNPAKTPVIPGGEP